MSKIKILPEILSNKIAAGEVVERPSSVVKELVENALDAASTRITIEVENGGRSLIRVADNGIGMDHDDALLSLERYATSKIYKDQDLFSINTLGFRGEAIPSIAAVSKFTLTTNDGTAHTGTEIVVEGGKIKRVSEVGAPKGTMVTIKQLFFNMPARKKFLKTTGTEMGHITDVVSGVTLAWPGTYFKLLHNGKVVNRWSIKSDPMERVVDVLGKTIKNDLHRIRLNIDDLSIAGWVSSPRITRSTSRGIYVYVNGRNVRDRIIQHALFEGYAGRLQKGQFPLAVLLLNVPAEQVDVNVHPAKHEIRFAQQKRIHDAVADAVSKMLRSTDRPGWPTNTAFSLKKHSVSEPVSHFPRTGIENKDSENKRLEARKKQENLWEKKRFVDLRLIGQLHNTYILCESDEELIVIDQHAAHERILFERLKNRSLKFGKEAQKLLIPETIDLGYREADALEKMIPGLKTLQLEIEPFGGNTFVVKSIPALLANREIRPLVVEIAEKMAETGFASDIERTIDQSLILMACHGAIRANHPLSEKEINGLLDQLEKCDNPSHCPHGRPTWMNWSFRFFEKSFGRIM
ncbi:MAG: DNA mismatch repair endonuclease MutL [Desulfobacterales bacterium]